MQILTSDQCAQVAGAQVNALALGIVGGSALVGGVLSYKAAQFAEPLSTALGTVGLGAVGAGLGLISPLGPLGAVIGGSLGALTGYCVSSSLTNLIAGGIGVAGGGALALMALESL